ncbi:Six-hairpin glycosidase-like protein [Aspergillus minisclerotigenes]|uniref:Six-hairpin glycosidase-like protein n=1 Tax=Aspergillus minisclerotigenes TaxID=656917 RepID=A0A5N6J0I8_9EURO|nr:Six-hairpin glycosidase-like protein [Aspergillus minisclerotigenes]
MLISPLLYITIGATIVHAAFDPSRFTWYTSPANNFTSTLPLGNGRLGAAVWGSTVENITLNENSIWSGEFMDRVNPDSYSALDPVRSMLKEGNITAAGQMTLANMVGSPDEPRAYHPLGSLVLDFGHEDSQVENYTRSLDLLKGCAVVHYGHKGVKFRREYFASHPAGVIAARLTASQAGRLNVAASLSRGRYVIEYAATAGNDTGSLKLRASTAESDGITFSAAARIVAHGGRVSRSASSVVVQNATMVDIFIDAETSYRFEDQEAWEAELNGKLDAAVRTGFPAIEQSATADHEALAGRVHLDLGSSGATGNLPTDVRLEKYKTDPDADPELVALMFQFGRYSLIVSSRDTGPSPLPPNLQALWNEDYEPAWGGRYTVNINLEMNYWPAGVTNLAETLGPLISLLETVKPRGQDIARRMYHCDNGGYVLHHNTDIWGDAVPVNNGTKWTMWPMGGAWLSANLMEYYHFTQNTTLLEERIWPLLRSAAQFYHCYLFSFDGYLSTEPSSSPENAFVVPNGMSQRGNEEGIDIAPTMDNTLLSELFHSIIETSKILGINNTDTAKAAYTLPLIKPPQIGSYGQILEWRREYQETEPGHRHMSPIFGLHPGSQMAPLVNSTLAAAAKVLLDNRIAHGSGSTGWSRAWTISLYSRLFDGDAAWNHTQVFLKTYPSANLWNTDSGPGSAFQIDGNFGFTAGIAEMLLQSHAEVVHLLPALPSAVPHGKVSGLVARGNFVVDMEWSDGKLTWATITARTSGKLAIRVQDGQQFSVNGSVYTEEISSVEGGIYEISLL